LVVGDISSGQGGDGAPGTFTQITTAAFNQIETWVAPDLGVLLGVAQVVEVGKARHPAFRVDPTVTVSTLRGTVHDIIVQHSDSLSPSLSHLIGYQRLDLIIVQPVTRYLGTHFSLLCKVNI
jgi:hypothetical protein